MKKIGIWTITPEGPSRIKESNLALEKQLEDWIENDPSLLQSGARCPGSWGSDHDMYGRFFDPEGVSE